MGIIAFSGKAQSGKDTSGSIVQILLNSPQLNNNGVKDFLRKQVQDNDTTYYDKWVIKKFADKLKEITALLIGCTREQLEDETFKNTELGEEWWYYKIYIGNGKYELVDYLNNDKSESWITIANPRYLVKTTPRLLLQLIGTECGRQIIHPQVWVNSTFVEYKPYEVMEGGKESVSAVIWSLGNGIKGVNQTVKVDAVYPTHKYPNWIITDMRFPNELNAIKSRKGLTIRINRENRVPCNNCQGGGCPTCNGFGYWIAERGEEHESETALDNGTFDYVIDNNGTLDELIDSIRNILKKEGFLTKD